MAATQEQIIDYLLDITEAQSEFGKKVALHCKLGRPNLKIEKIELSTLEYCVKCMEKYFGSSDYETNNFLSIDEAKDIMERINSICKTFIYIEL